LAIASGELKPEADIESSFRLIEKICGWNSWIEGVDSVELLMWAEDLEMPIDTVHDLILLLERIDRRYETP